MTTMLTTMYVALVASVVFGVIRGLPMSNSGEALTMPNVVQLPYQPPKELRQFIGSSVIGGLMWPVLLTLALTAMAARVPDFFQRIFSGGGRSFDYNSRLNLLANSEISLPWEQKLEETLRIFQRAAEAFEDNS